jgi:predicted hotdog family 3-hydroxylacyl-ACP dehydratase
MKLNKSDIQTLIPHSGSMCLIDKVINWDNQRICCASCSHLDPNNPLMEKGVLSACHLLEYGTQAMAIHGGLLSNKAIPGFLAAIRNARLHIDTLEGIHDALIINATAISQSTSGAIYEFQISCNEEILVAARATIINTADSY